MSVYLKKQLVKAAYNGSIFVPPERFYVALYTSTGPSETDATVNELSGQNYARAEWFPTMVDEDGLVTNSTRISFLPAVESWDQITYIGVVDEAGNLLDYGQITTPRTIYNNSSFAILPGEIVIQYNDVYIPEPPV